MYNSGRYRMAGRGSLAGLLAFGNANEIVVEMAYEILPVVNRTPVLTGVNGTDALTHSWINLNRMALLESRISRRLALSRGFFVPISKRPAWDTA
jgi:predicted TIM-barrel enzyme